MSICFSVSELVILLSASKEVEYKSPSTPQARKAISKLEVLKVSYALYRRQRCPLSDVRRDAQAFRQALDEYRLSLNPSALRADVY